MNRRRIHGGTGIATVLIAAGLLAPAGASAAPAAPGVTTGAVANKAQTTTTLTGRINPNGAETTYTFEYGTTRVYGAQAPVPPTSVGKGTTRKAVAVDIAGLAPATTYHYRLVASNSQGVRRGSDRTFKTKRQPLGLTLGASQNPVAPGGNTTIAGTLSGTGNGGRQVVLQSNPFPYTAGFQNASNVQLTNADGTFAFPVLGVPLNTQYRVVLPNVPSVQSPIVAVGVAPKVTVKTRRVRKTARGAIVRFRGRVTPAHDGTQVAIQKLKKGTWVTIQGTITKHHSSAYSRYRKSVRLRRGGTFRVYVGIADGDHVASTSRSVRVRVHR
jgi:hypothetical protein